jgi:hypothetical protein
VLGVGKGRGEVEGEVEGGLVENGVGAAICGSGDENWLVPDKPAATLASSGYPLLSQKPRKL